MFVLSVSSLASPGTLVHARGREWVVLPGSDDQLLLVRPVGGLDEEITGLLTAVDNVCSARFRLPSLEQVGDFRCGKILRDAARLSTRAASGPFRSFARIAVEPRPYQLVPLMMALKLDPIRLLIADDVGIGKTIEAGLIAREMLDRAEIQRFAVLCPPPLAEQWQRELSEKFHVPAQLVLPSTIQRLERDLPIGGSVFERHPFTIVSTDFIKTPRRVQDFLQQCPEMVIVDEAHGCTLAGGVGRGRQLRFELLNAIAQRQDRHLVLVTATPHSGNEAAFRSLLSLLSGEFANLPEDLAGPQREGMRRKLARHLVQRRRADIRDYLSAQTPFPERLDAEVHYSLSPEYRSLFDDILSFAREFVGEEGESQRSRRVRYWSALALLRCVSSSPAAAAATLRTRSALQDLPDEELEEAGRRTVLDLGEQDDALALDLNPGSETETQQDKTRRKMLEFARRAEAITPEQDHKFQGLQNQLKGLLRENFSPVVFCRFVDTADYLAKLLSNSLPARVRVESVTGQLPPSEREKRIADLVAPGGEYVLVATDCLSEGINLQTHFNAVLHYDLAWNPTRHEQREGRVDRFGQQSAQVRVVTYFGQDNPIDGVILDVLLRKHKSIKNDLGVTVSVPGSSEQIVETLFEGALLRERTRERPGQIRLDFVDETKKQELHTLWEDAREKEKASRSRFAQHSIDPKQVAEELQNIQDAIGRSEQVASFFHHVFQALSIPLRSEGNQVQATLDNNTPRGLRQALGIEGNLTGRFALPLQKGETYLGRTSPPIEGLASWVLDQALDTVKDSRNPVAARTGVYSTSLVARRTVLLLLRFRFNLFPDSRGTQSILCEQILPWAFRGSPETPEWLPGEQAEQLLSLRPERNLLPAAVEQQLTRILPALPELQQKLQPIAQQRAQEQLQSHRNVRDALGKKANPTIRPVLPVDILGAWVLLPPGGAQ